MRARWEAFHASLVEDINQPVVRSRLRSVCARCPALGRFSGPHAVLDFLHAGRDGLDEKDEVVAALVAATRDAGDQALLSQQLLWLGLWPGLDAIYRRRLRHLRHAPEELVSEIAEAFTAAVARADLRRIRRVAATLVRNTERDVVESLRPSWARADAESTLPSDEDIWLATRPPKPSILGLPSYTDVDDEIAAIRKQLASLVGDDTTLVIGAALYGEDLHELADRLAITHDAARKRLQRALARLRPCFARRS